MPGEHYPYVLTEAEVASMMAVWVCPRSSIHVMTVNWVFL